MRLRITTPLTVAIDEDAIVSVRAEDESGGFGIMNGHADFLTSLTISVVDWKRADGSRHYCAVRGGLLSVTAGKDVSITTREAVPGDDLATLHDVVLARFRDDLDAERNERVGGAQLELAAIRRIMQRLRPDGGGRSL
ncbi:MULTISPECIES: F0F1 ATP synthase subunit epsilon [unclassified Hyphomicrobium]|uniref:F0F1 ATP synthase subunit epsilon n=1 Tax=unclassified Hyphomicrobium TaxID=2619925 RepID=UPI000213D5D7|nr:MULTISPECIES: F0F1 ATP synthase subunit epsilon [unclassified Hyphomicrobium]CCB65655.1 ATP synthase epsilon chain 2 [Hyphomicrobium sp. MC1]